MGSIPAGGAITHCKDESMNLSDICNNHLLSGLEMLRTNNEYKYEITYLGIVFTSFSIVGNQIFLSDSSRLNSLDLDINCFVELCLNNHIQFNVFLND